MSDDAGIRGHLATALRGGDASDTFETIIAEVPVARRFVRPPGGERSAFDILWHMRFALEDINDFTDNESQRYMEPEWPAKYWPEEDGDWDVEVAAYLRERERMEALILDPSRDLVAPFPSGTGQTLLREALVAIDHNAHHLGQLIELSRWLESDASSSRS